MVSVVIPAYNEEKVIGACLDSLVKQKTQHKFEVIVVNNNSTDKTADAVNSYRNRLELNLVMQKEKGRGPARQIGFSHACGDIILSTDADTVVPPGWVETLSDSLRGSNAVAISGTCKIVDCGLFTNTLFNFFQPLAMRVYRLVFGHYWLNGFNFAIYKEVYRKSGGFNVKLNSQEDIDLSFKVSKLGKIHFMPGLPVIFSGRRFRQKGLIRGSLPYLLTFIGYFFYKNEGVILSDVR